MRVFISNIKVPYEKRWRYIPDDPATLYHQCAAMGDADACATEDNLHEHMVPCPYCGDEPSPMLLLAIKIGAI
jgi:hypothetical protein